MANIKSQKKRILTNEKSRVSNKIFNSQIKTAIKKAQLAQKQDLENKGQLTVEATSLIDRGVKKGVIKPNKAARSKSRLMKKIIENQDC